VARAAGGQTLAVDDIAQHKGVVGGAATVMEARLPSCPEVLGGCKRIGAGVDDLVK
jgi:hypothetical protein